MVWVVNPQTMFGFQLFPVSTMGKALRVCWESKCHQERWPSVRHAARPTSQHQWRAHNRQGLQRLWRSLGCSPIDLTLKNGSGCSRPAGDRDTLTAATTSQQRLQTFAEACTQTWRGGSGSSPAHVTRLYDIRKQVWETGPDRTWTRVAQARTPCETPPEVRCVERTGLKSCPSRCKRLIADGQRAG